MATTLPQRDKAHSFLPQYGFGTCLDFGTLVKTNHFLFRVYTPKERSPFFDDSDPFFLAPKFNERHNRSPLEISHGDPVCYRGTYDDVVKHMNWTSRSSSIFISTSFSFIWSIWEALRRYHLGVKKDIQIAVIDASAVSGRAVTAVELLREGDPSERPSKYWKWYRFSQESQSVLVYELIPAAAVLASIPLLTLLEKLPSYMLRVEIPRPLKNNSVAAVAWNYAEKKPSYRQFCQNMSARFLQLSPETRLRDTTAGSVGLALTFLRPWVHKYVLEDFQMATATLYALALSIAQWPGQWAQEHPEMLELIRAIIISVAEEIRVKQQDSMLEVARLQDVVSELKEVQVVEQRRATANSGRLQSEITRLEAAREREQDDVLAETIRLRSAIGGLEETVKKQEVELLSRGTGTSTRSLTPLVIPPPLKGGIKAISPTLILAPLSHMPHPYPRYMPTPITPPTSPVHSIAPGFPLEISELPDPEASPTTETSGLPSPIKSAPPSPTIPAPTSPVQSLAGEELPFASPVEQEPVISPLSPSPPIIPTDKVELSPSVEPPEPAEAESPSPDQGPSIDILIPQHGHSVPLRSARATGRVRGQSTFAETASVVVTGFLVGAVITLCLLSPQRRTLLTNLT